MDNLYFIFYLGVITWICDRILSKAGKKELAEFMDMTAFIIALFKVFNMIRDLINVVSVFN